MSELYLLILSAAFLGFIHTLLGPDHYLPFIVLSKARQWSQSKTLVITLLSGIGHVLGSVVIGVTGIAMGIGLHKLEALESYRGNIVAWLLIVFGLAYFFYGMSKYIKNRGHAHLFSFLLPKKVKEFHNLSNEQFQQSDGDQTKLTPWILFLIFVFGPCEILIPLLIFPASEFNGLGIAMVSLVFGLSTVFTMLVIVFVGFKGASILNLKNGETYFHLIAGVVILMSGLGMQFLGW